MTETSKPSTVILWSIFGAASLLYVALNPQYRTGAFNDDATYVISAENLWDANTSPLQALVHSRPDFPFPGLPLLLSPFVKLVQPHWVLVEWLSVCVTLLSVFLLQLFLRRWLTVKETLPLLAIYAFNPTVGKYSGVLLPTLYFITAVLAVFLLVERLLSRSSWPTALGLGLVLGWGSLVRPEGFLLIASVPLVLIYHRRWQDLARVLLVPAICWALFLAKWVGALKTLDTEYGGDLSALLAYWPHHLKELLFFSGRMARVIFYRMLTGLTMPKTFWGILGASIEALVCFILTCIGYFHFWKNQPQRRGLLLGIGFFCASYIVVHMLWHVAISRYCVVILPFVLLFLYHGSVVWWNDGLQRKCWLSFCAVVLTFSYSYRNGYAVHQSLWAPNPMNLPPWESLSWLQHHTTASDQILSVIAPNVILYAQRAAVSMVSAQNEEDFLNLLNTMHIDYVVDRAVQPISVGVPLADDPAKKWDRIRHWVQRRPSIFPLVYEKKTEKVAIYEVHSEPKFIDAYRLYTSAVKELNQGQGDAGVQTLKDALLIYPTLGTAHNALGIAYYLSRAHLDLAEREFLKAKGLLPDDPATFLNLACLYHLEGQYAKSWNCIQKSIAISKQNGESAAFIKRVQFMHDQRAIDLPDDFLQLTK